jgi:hypothetical protein
VELVPVHVQTQSDRGVDAAHAPGVAAAGDGEVDQQGPGFSIGFLPGGGIGGDENTVGMGQITKGRMRNTEIAHKIPFSVFGINEKTF